MRDRAMGRYMDTFARMEGMIQMVIQELLDLDPISARPIFATLGTKQSIDLLGASAKTALNSKDAKRVTDLVTRISKRNLRRNHIVHGRWHIHITPSEAGQTEEWIRVYGNVDPSLDALDPLSEKLIGTYNFTVPALDKATDHAEEMVQALSVLLLDTPMLLARRHTPEEMWSHLVSAHIAANAAVNLHLGPYQKL